MPRLVPANLSSSAGFRLPHSSATTNFHVVIFLRLRAVPSQIPLPSFCFTRDRKGCAVGSACNMGPKLGEPKSIYLHWFSPLLKQVFTQPDIYIVSFWFYRIWSIIYILNLFIFLFLLRAFKIFFVLIL